MFVGSTVVFWGGSNPLARAARPIGMRGEGGSLRKRLQNMSKLTACLLKLASLSGSWSCMCANQISKWIRAHCNWPHPSRFQVPFPFSHPFGTASQHETTRFSGACTCDHRPVLDIPKGTQAPLAGVNPRGNMLWFRGTGYRGAP